MLVKCLIENTALTEGLEKEHGLSVYLETNQHKLLFDMGQSDHYLINAQKMGVKISEVDLAFISHGHYDHGGGLKAFLEENRKAQIYVSRFAFSKHAALQTDGTLKDIGLDEALKDNERLIFVGEYLRIDEELELFSKIEGNEFRSRANKTLLQEQGDGYAEDPFEHEQNLIVTENGKTLLLAGCAHRGIVNIVRQFIALKGRAPDYVIGGFHLSNPRTNVMEDPGMVRQVGEILYQTGSQYYTGHCTGMAAYELLKQIMKERVSYFAGGIALDLS